MLSAAVNGSKCRVRTISLFAWDLAASSKGFFLNARPNQHLHRQDKLQGYMQKCSLNGSKNCPWVDKEQLHTGRISYLRQTSQTFDNYNLANKWSKGMVLRITSTITNLTITTSTLLQGSSGDGLLVNVLCAALSSQPWSPAVSILASVETISVVGDREPQQFQLKKASLHRQTYTISAYLPGKVLLVIHQIHCF